MQNISVYDIEARIIEKIADDNNLTNAEVIELLVEYADEMKRDNGLK